MLCLMLLELLQIRQLGGHGFRCFLSVSILQDKTPVRIANSLVLWGTVGWYGTGERPCSVVLT